ncbi:MAG: hypothetical protein AAGI07_00530 [Bacteroidota bacterium]
MKKIGILFGQENSFPPALIERINSKKITSITAEAVFIDKVIQAEPTGYTVIIDRISQDVPFYRSYLKNAALCGTAVINNPFWWSADEKFFNSALAEKIGVKAPKTVLFPSKHRPDNTSEASFSNLALPLNYEAIFDYVGFPAFFKPFSGGGWKNVYKVYNRNDFFDVYNETGQLVMMLQENIDFESYFRCYYVGGRVHIMPYEPRNEFHERYLQNAKTDKALLKKVETVVRKLNEHLGYDFNTVEIAVKDGELYPIDFCNPAPDADEFSVGKENFEWIVENAAQYAIERAQQQKAGQTNLTWGKFVTGSVETFKTLQTIEEKSTPKPKLVPKKSITKTKASKSKPTAKSSLLDKLSEKQKKIITGLKKGEKDDLKIINGIGPAIEKKLNGLGIMTIKQISMFDKGMIAKVVEAIEYFPDRIKRDDWVGQAKKMSKRK